MEFFIKSKKVFAFSDTHGLHEKLCIDKGYDVIVCVGDGTYDFLKKPLVPFMQWLSCLPCNNIIFVPGNHEFFLEDNLSLVSKYVPSHVTLLLDKVIELEGIYFAAIGINTLREHSIPASFFTKKFDVLLTHEPPYGILDAGFGSKELFDKQKFMTFNYHIFGHVHNFGGESLEKNGRVFSNVAKYDSLCTQGK